MLKRINPLIGARQREPYEGNRGFGQPRVPTANSVQTVPAHFAIAGLQAKIAGERMEGSSTPRDVAMMAFGVLNRPVALVQAALSSMIRRPLLGSAEEMTEAEGSGLTLSPGRPLSL
mgnify:FL=1